MVVLGEAEQIWGHRGAATLLNVSCRELAGLAQQSLLLAGEAGLGACFWNAYNFSPTLLLWQCLGSFFLYPKLHKNVHCTECIFSPTVVQAVDMKS